PRPPSGRTSRRRPPAAPSRGTRRPPSGPGAPAYAPPPCPPCSRPSAARPGRSRAPPRPSPRVRPSSPRTAARRRRRSGRSLVLLLFALHPPRPGLHLARHQREVLAERVPLEQLGQQQLHRLRMSLEPDAEHLHRLALMPVARRVQVADRRGDRVLVRETYLDPDVVVVLGG